MCGLTASNLPLCVVWGQSPAKGQYSIDIDMLQLRVGGWRGTSSLQPSRLQPHQGINAKENVAESAQGYNWKGVLLQPHHPGTILRSGAMQQLTARTVASFTLSCSELPHYSGRNECTRSLKAQPTPSTKLASPGS
jgi:hypothetical protein